MRPKLTYANVVSTVCLFVLLGGGAYAASKINGKTIKPKSLPGNRIVPNTVTGAQLKESSLKIVPVAKKAETANTAAAATNATNANTATNAQNADKVDGHDATCTVGTQLFLGACWDSAPRAATTVSAAATSCANLGGALPPTHELVAFSKVATLGNTNEWSSEINTVAAADNYTQITVSKTGSINFTAPTDLKEFHCVFPLVR